MSRLIENRAWRCGVRRRAVRHGRALRSPLIQGVAMHRQCVATRGLAHQGEAWPGKGGLFREPSLFQYCLRRGEPKYGTAVLGQARRGPPSGGYLFGAVRGPARQVVPRRGEERALRSPLIDFLGGARRCMVTHSTARRGEARTGSSEPTNSTSEAWHPGAGQSEASLGSGPLRRATYFRRNI